MRGNEARSEVASNGVEIEAKRNVVSYVGWRYNALLKNFDEELLPSSILTFPLLPVGVKMVREFETLEEREVSDEGGAIEWRGPVFIGRFCGGGRVKTTSLFLCIRIGELNDDTIGKMAGMMVIVASNDRMLTIGLDYESLLMES